MPLRCFVDDTTYVVNCVFRWFRLDPGPLSTLDVPGSCDYTVAAVTSKAS